MAEKEIKRPEAVDVTFANMKAKKIIRTDGTIAITVNQEPYLEKLGIEKAVRDEVIAKVNAVNKDVLKAMSDMSLDNGLADVEVRLGSGAFSMEHTLQSKYQRGGVNPTTKEPYKVHYGRITSRLNMPFGKELKGEGKLIDEIEKAHEAAWAKKK